jgi:hypothetical protein
MPRPRDRACRLVGAAQGQRFAQRRLVDLDDADARALQVLDLVADAERDLAHDVAQCEVIAGKRPFGDRDRTGEHSLHRPPRERLRITRELDGDGRGPFHIAVDDRRLHAARAVALYPAVRRGDEAAEMLGEELHHVVALGLAMDQNVEADLFLRLDDAADFLTHLLVVFLMRYLPAPMCGPDRAQVGGLRKRADRRGGKERQRDGAVLRAAALGEGAGATRRLRFPR